MKALLRLVFLIAGLLPTVEAAQNTQARLLLSHTSARAGESVTAALQLRMAPGWHTYWRNPGDAGMATSIEWKLAPGITAGEIQWPVPEKLVVAKLFGYVYGSEVLLLVPVQIAADAKPGMVELKGQASWLECAEACIPGDSPISAKLAIGTESKPSEFAALIDQWRERLPRSGADIKISGRWEGPAQDDSRNILIEWTPKEPAAKPDFFPYEAEDSKVQADTELLQASPLAIIRKAVESSKGKWPSKVKGLVLDAAKKHPTAYEVEFSVPDASGTAAATPANAVASGAHVAAKPTLLLVLGFAFLGGLILNIMPCVLPVIALKILSFVKQSGSEPRKIRELGLIYGLGVLASFLTLAGIVIAVQRAGGLASWGMQYQSPVFLVCMIILVTLISLNLFGVFEITLGGSALGAASELAGREGKSGAFFNGVLATVLGTSCTAPFLAAAIGYALSQPALIIMLVFAMMGIGLAFPYLLLTWNPKLLSLLFRPGPWMDRFKNAMGFPMLATAIWLYGVAVKAHFGREGATWLAMFLVLLAFAAWIWGEFVQRGSKRKPLSMAISLGTLIMAVSLILEGRLHWRNPVYAKDGSSAPANRAGGIRWQNWSPEAVAAARAKGHPVLIDFTADWCLNCQANKLTSIEIDSVEKKLKEINAEVFLADFTRKNPQIAEELRRFERGGVPLVLVYPADLDQPPIVLPPTLTPQIVLNALDQAASQAEKTAATRSPDQVAVAK